MINLFELCLWFIAKKTGLILWKLYKLLWLKIEEAPTKMWTRWRTDWFILTADFWFDETLFPRVKKSFRDCDWMKKFPYAFFMRSILSQNLSKYEISRFSFQTVSRTAGFIHLIQKWSRDVAWTDNLQQSCGRFFKNTEFETNLIHAMDFVSVEFFCSWKPLSSLLSWAALTAVSQYRFRELFSEENFIHVYKKPKNSVKHSLCTLFECCVWSLVQNTTSKS